MVPKNVHMAGLEIWKVLGNDPSLQYRVFTPCGNDETKFRFPQKMFAETIRKRR